MRAINFSIGDRVMTIERGALRKGTIKKVFPEMNIPVLVVEFDDGEIEKVNIDQVAFEPKTENEKVQEPTEPVEKSEITITPAEFKKITANVIAEEMEKMEKGGAMLGLGFTIFSAKLHRALFFDAVDND